MTSSNLVIGLKHVGVEISADEIQKVFYYLSNKKSTLPLELLFITLLSNYTDER